MSAKLIAYGLPGGPRAMESLPRVIEIPVLEDERRVGDPLDVADSVRFRVVQYERGEIFNGEATYSARAGHDQERSNPEERLYGKSPDDRSGHEMNRYETRVSVVPEKGLDRREVARMIREAEARGAAAEREAIRLELQAEADAFYKPDGAATHFLTANPLDRAAAGALRQFARRLETPRPTSPCVPAKHVWSAPATPGDPCLCGGIQWPGETPR
jgi:hypothetical protein